MDLNNVMEFLKGLHPVIPLVLSLLGALVVVGGIYVKLTPNQDDDAWFAKLEAMPVLGQILKVLIAMSPVRRKE
jgi:Na+-transporting NADH:ubiquinone oxidoreductase subunit NqrC